MKEALLVQYAGVTRRDTVAGGDRERERSRRRSARVHGRSPVDRDRERGRARTVRATRSTAGRVIPARTRFTWTTFDSEGTWHWNVQATDDANRQSTADQTFVYDLTLTGLSVPRTTTAAAGLQVGFSLSRPATVTLQIETKAGTVVDVLPPSQLAAGAQSLLWDGMTSGGGPAPPGEYVARVTDTSSIGTVGHHGAVHASPLGSPRSPRSSATTACSPSSF